MSLKHIVHVLEKRYSGSERKLLALIVAINSGDNGEIVTTKEELASACEITTERLVGLFTSMAACGYLRVWTTDSGKKLHVRLLDVDEEG